jgi:hypothetical protein
MMPYDVYIAFGQREANTAAKLQKDLPKVGFTIHPATAFHQQIADDVRAIVALQATYKPADVVRAAVAAAQHPDLDRPIVAAYVQDDKLALQRIGREPHYMPYEKGRAQLVIALWRTLESPYTETIGEPPADEPDPFDWLVRQQQKQR